MAYSTVVVYCPGCRYAHTPPNCWDRAAERERSRALAAATLYRLADGSLCVSSGRVTFLGGQSYWLAPSPSWIEPSELDDLEF